MNEAIKILLAAILFAGIGYPLVIRFDKWKKAMEDEEKSNDIND